MNYTKSYIKDYPRPQFVREQWQDLNGTWDFKFDPNDEGLDKKYYLGFETDTKIKVPFPFECKESGIGEVKDIDVVWYQLKFTPKFYDRVALLTFEGVDYETTIYVNGVEAGYHKGAYTRFNTDITKLLKNGENLLVLRVKDDKETDRPRGKQTWVVNNIECWYQPVTGIFKSVWIDYPMKRTYIESVKIIPSLNDYSVSFKPIIRSRTQNTFFKVKVSFKDLEILETTIKVNKAEESFSVNLESNNIFFKQKQWSPENPNLYDVEFFLMEGENEIDNVKSYFGLRDIRIEGNKILLNNNICYLKLVLDQGYYKDSLITPKSEEELVRDIELVKEMGFNGVRKHQKTEDERYLYYADIMGLFVWCELPSNYIFTEQAKENITIEWTDIVRQFYNHPSIITWVIFNESWGVGNISRNIEMQNLAISLYYLTKAYDPMRPVISNDGWEHTKSDILTIHQYQQDADILYSYYREKERMANGYTIGRSKIPFAKGFNYEGQPIIVSEYGGTSFLDENQTGWGYGKKLVGKDEYIKKIDELTSTIKALPWCAGYCYTQFTDVEQEINGLLYMDRRPKVDTKIIKEINDKFVSEDRK